MDKFVIDSMAWYRHLTLNQDLRLRFFVLMKFLQEHGLTKSPAIGSISDIDDSFSLKSSDLTDEGMLLMKDGYSRWVRGIDKGKSPEDVRILEKSLKKIRG
jgi:hypothetical protein